MAENDKQINQFTENTTPPSGYFGLVDDGAGNYFKVKLANWLKGLASLAGMPWFSDDETLAGAAPGKAVSERAAKVYVDNNAGADLSWDAGTATVQSSSGADATLSAASAVNAGLMASADKSKLDGIEAGATADQSGAEIKTAYEGEANTNAYTDSEKTKLAGIEAGATADQTAKNSIEIDADALQLVGDVAAPGNNKVFGTDGVGARGWKDDPAGGDEWGDPVNADIVPDADGTRNLGANLNRFQALYADAAAITGNINVGGNVDGRDVAADGSKLDGIEAGATADQSGAEIKTAYEGEANTNAYTDSEKTKLAGIEAGATADQTAKNSIEIDADALQLVGDVAAPGNNKVFGTDGVGARGWKDDPGGGGGTTLGLFHKSDPASVAWAKTAAFTAETAQALDIEVNGSVVNIAASTAITMPGSPVAGTDYTIWLHPDGTLEATSSYTSAPVANARRVGGFHYAPGGNAAAQAGGDTTPQINEYSFWDLKWRPACPDPRGMTLVARKFWTDIYMLGVDHHLNGTSAHGVTIADDTDPPKVPSEFGGDGTAVYSNANWWNLTEVLAAHGKRPPTYHEFSAFAYGVTEAAARGNDPITTGLSDSNVGTSNADEKFTSKWGVIQATGCLSIMSVNFGGPNGTSSFSANTQGRGSTHTLSNGARFGGNWANGTAPGSRCSVWHLALTVSDPAGAARGCCDHLRLG